MELKKVAFEPMNKVHQKEYEILKKLLQKIENKEPLIDEYLEFLKDVENHFAFEEDLMKKYNFFAYVPHKMEHDRVLNEIYDLKEHLDDYEYLENYFKNTFLPWLDNHISTMDTVTAGFFDMIGAKI